MQETFPFLSSFTCVSLFILCCGLSVLECMCQLSAILSLFIVEKDFKDKEINNRTFIFIYLDWQWASRMQAWGMK